MDGSSNMLEPQFVPVRFEHDIKKRRAKVSVGDLLENVTEPVRNLATGEVHVVRVHSPNGMEYKGAETAMATVNKATGPIAYDWPNGHSSLAPVVQTWTSVPSGTRWRRWATATTFRWRPSTSRRGQTASPRRACAT